MSSLSQIVVVVTFLAYSFVYLLFVSWAADRARLPAARSRKPLPVLLLGALLPMLLILFLVSNS